MTTEINPKGQFVRQGTAFNTPFGNEKGQLPIEAGRYRLFWSPVCPWAHRAVIVRSLLGLEDVISLGTADPLRPKIGRVDWAFTLDENEVDPVLGIPYLSDIYLETDSTYEGRPTVPVVVDVINRKVVYNNYFRLTNELETAWKPYQKDGAPDLYPPTLQEAIDELNDTIYHDVNNGVYKCGFAQSQQAYEEAFDKLFERLEELENRLAKNRFLFGNYITDSDVRLYVTLIRFDIAYYSAFKTNKKLIRDYENLANYVRDLYQTPGFGDTTDIEAIKIHYFLSNHIKGDDVKGTSILPKGPDNDWLVEPHNREKLSGIEEKFLVRKENAEVVIRTAGLCDYEAIKAVL